MLQPLLLPIQLGHLLDSEAQVGQGAKGPRCVHGTARAAVGGAGGGHWVIPQMVPQPEAPFSASGSFFI